MRIDYYTNNEIDKERWDRFIGSSIMPQIYATSWMLDIASPNWGALVGSNWEWVMPIPRRQKFGIPYVVQPMFFQQLGIFSHSQIADENVKSSIQFLRNYFPFVRYQFNRINNIDPNTKGIRMRHTFEVELGKHYDGLAAGFSSSHRKNLNKARSRGVTVRASNDPSDYIEMAKLMYNSKGVDALKPTHFDNLIRFAEHGIQFTDSKLYYAHSDNGTTVGAALYLNWGRQYVIFTARTQEGIEKRCSFVLVDQFLRDHAGNHGYLDFAGSDLPGVAEFNAGWGASRYIYPHFASAWLPNVK